jgi:Mn2+/Fe2+ NRAMP family transporter
MKALNWIGWISGGIGVVIVVVAVISILSGKNLFGYRHAANYFQAANSFFLMAIAAFIVVYRCDCRK